MYFFQKAIQRKEKNKLKYCGFACYSKISAYLGVIIIEYNQEYDAKCVGNVFLDVFRLMSFLIN